ncbi:MAG: glycoside hydrolase family 18 protein [Bacteroidales bacterium]|nr:glycoside hydrolase family 18 protein [Bacteroidales bacterium]
MVQIFRAVLTVVSLMLLISCGPKQVSVNSSSNVKKIIAYIFPSNDTIDTSKIDIGRLTHINYSFAKINNGCIETGYLSDSINLRLLREHIDKNNPKAALIISVGGWEFSDQFSDMALSGTSRKKFIESALKFIQYFKLDGIDVDWEYPGRPGKTNNFRAEDKTTFNLLLDELRQALDSIGIIDNKHYITSVAIPAFHEFYATTEVTEFSKHLDFINLMTYDFYGEWEPVSGHQSNLYDAKSPKYLSADSAVRFLLQKNIPADKIVLGIPFYSRSWKITGQSNNENIHNLGQGAGINSVYEDLLSEYININGYNQHWDSSACVPYLWNENLDIFVTYENPESVKIKCEYIKDNKLGGAMFWKYNLQKENLLLNVIYNELN